MPESGLAEERAATGAGGRASRVTRAALATFITLGLAGAAAWYLGYHILIGLDLDDTNHLETPLALTITRQLYEGPGVLYGPFNGDRPLVLIHAPFYYRLSALVAWPFFAAGVDPVLTPLPFYAGRAVSFLGTVGACAAAFGLARVAGGSRMAGLWAVLLIAGSPVFGSFPATVRPDTLGVALQTLGAFLVVRVLVGEKRPGATLAVAYAAFGLAFCVKQHDVMTAAVSSALLAAAWRRGAVPYKPIERAHLVGLAVVLAYYGAEELVTGGMMFRSVFLIPSKLRVLQPADWEYVLLVFIKTRNLAIGLLAVELGCLIGLGISRAAGAPRGTSGSRVDVWILAYTLAELAFMALLCKNSSGAWTNYAMQAAVFGSVLVARQMARRLEAGVPWPAAVPVALAVVGFLLVDVRLVSISARGRRDNREGLLEMFTNSSFRDIRPEEVYFVGKPQNNRLFGRAGLAHDEWLYTSYEMIDAAEPRTRWLLPLLTTGPVRRIVIARDSPSPIPMDPPVIRGIPDPVPSLGFKKVAEFGHYNVWDRTEEAPREPQPRRLAPRS